MRKILLVLIGLVFIVLFALIPEVPSTAYPPSTPLPPVTEEPPTLPEEYICDNYFRTFGATCHNAYLWWRGRPPYVPVEELFVYAETWDKTASILAPVELIGYVDDGELFYTELDPTFMSGSTWTVKGKRIISGWNYECVTVNSVVASCGEQSVKSMVKLPIIVKATWLNP